ncbi:hypothetical protein B0H13DRAFT_1988455 [Mycena leptocephala]|nr:hypothetical protein B0H13DRAFT_1988455 [Mycena leptocephala]
MPRTTQKLETRNRGNQILQHTTAAAHLLLNITDDGAAGSKNPYLKGIAGISILLLETVQIVKSNKSQCLALLERIHEIISAIINLCGDGGVLSPTILRSLSQFFDTLQKVHAFVRSQVDIGLFRRVLRHAETAALLEDCNAGLQHASDVFRIHTALGTSAAVTSMEEQAEIRHEEILELLQQANGTRSVSGDPSSTTGSSLGLLPSSPQIFHGRDRELEELLRMLLGPDPFRAAILGPGGIGKSSLALAVLHHTDLVSRFGSCRYFISLESSKSASDMLSAIAAFFGIDESPKLSRAIVKHLSYLAKPCLLCLDNLEDCWETLNSRSEVEEFLSLLSDVPHLQLMVTMRGAERPAKVKWTRPFLPPLDRLDDMAARQTFLDIVDEADSEEITALLALTDNLPLAITLMAHVTSFEGGQSVLNRWASETTSLLSDGFDKQGNLDKSIMISLSSPRMFANPHARELLSVIKSTLLRCSLIYAAADGRLRMLVPIRQYVAEKSPPTAESFDGVCTYFYELARLFRVPMDMPNRELVQRLSAEFTNVRAVTAYALSRSLRLLDTVRCTIDLLHFNKTAKSAAFELSDAVHQAVEHLGDPVLKGDYLLAQARYLLGQPSCLPIASEGLHCFEEQDDAFGQVRALYTLASHLTLTGQFQKAIEAADRGARLAQQSANPSMQALCMAASCTAYRNKGDLQTSLDHGREACRLAQVAGNMTVESWVTQQYSGSCVMVANTTLLSALGLADLDVLAYRNVLNVNAEILDRRTEYEAARALRIRIYDARRVTDDLTKAWDLLNIALTEIELGDLASVRQRIDAAQGAVSPTVWEAAGLDILSEIIEADLNFHDGHYRRAEEGFQRAVTRTDWTDLAIIAIEKLSNVALKTKDLTSAMRYTVLLLASAQTTHDPAATNQAFRRFGDISLANGDEISAMNLFQVALEGFRLMGIHRGTGDCLIRMGDVLKSRGDQSKAVEMWREARPLFEKSSQKADVVRCDGRLNGK